MSTHSYSFPTSIRLGAGCVDQIPELLEELGVKKPLLVTDPGLLATPAFAKVQEVLGEDGKGTEWILFSETHPNPIESDVLESARIFRESGCDGVVALGGGSALDVGKALRLWVKEPQLKLDEYDWMHDWSGLVPCIALPTTAGTGSEVGRSSVITSESTHRKVVLFHPALLPACALLDPELSCSLPPKLTAATALDALTHCIESFTSPVFHPMCDGIALEGIHLVAEALPIAYEDGSNLEAREKLLIAASMGAVAFQKDLGAAHSMAHPLSTALGLHHGTANALVLPTVMKWNAEKKSGLYRRVGQALGLAVVGKSDSEADQLVIQWVQDFCAKFGFADGLAAHGVKEEHILTLAAQAFEDPCHQTNPVPVTERDFRELYKLAM